MIDYRVAILGLLMVFWCAMTGGRAAIVASVCKEAISKGYKLNECEEVRQ